ncbi:Multidrug resistance-associated protein/mitoxantrone resistance protein, ABC superfamily [Ceraceosorus bombacis]|uniref:Multidrug resistance-associated protein/mitoxantrone resistance protein, ABC superfamily n=1 Tax=Ceraceosorus bombacis TaxID=401625 RepID=A0A0P1BDC0_9BASI|nr:Multidrug resistance-associated protein/mitoxantrone resistance protein, ABC superfamily [Ceraceosorus bombacis]
MASLSCAATWLLVLSLLLLRPPKTPPLAASLLLLLHILLPLRRILDHLPALLSDRSTLAASDVVPPLLDAILTGVCLFLILSMPTAPGGWDGQVPMCERQRLVDDVVTPETENIKESYEASPTTPEDYCSLYQSLTYTWMAPLQKLALSRPLLPTDIWRLRSVNDVSILYRKFSALLASRQGSSTRRLISALLSANKRDIVCDALWKVISVSLAYAGPALMRRILEALTAAAQENRQALSEGQKMGAGLPIEWTPRSLALALAIATLFATAAQYVAQVRSYHNARQVGLRIRITLVMALLEKALKRRDLSGAQEEVTGAPAQNKNERTPLKGASERKGAIKAQQAIKESRADVGKVVNMIGTDINTLLRLGCDAHQLYGAPMETVLATLLLYRLMGWASLAGAALLILVLPINHLMGRVAIRVQRRWRTATDKRISLVASVLTNIKFVKQQGVEARWRDRILLARNDELNALIRVRLLDLAFIALWLVTPIAVTLTSIYCYTYVQGNQLTVPVAFTAITLFAMLRTPLNVIPTFVSVFINSAIAVSRIAAFLDEEEVEVMISGLKCSPGMRTPSSLDISTATSALRIEGPAAFVWHRPKLDASSAMFTLQLPTLDFPPAGLCVVSGPTASGKSTLLHSLLGETICLSGKLVLNKFVDGRRSDVSYAGQSPWLQAGLSVRQNILYITPYDAVRYETILKACALVEDLQEMKDGDATRIAAGTLSGGQKARVCLARALYARTSTIILDDVLSAVDARVQKHLIHHALTAPIARGRRIVLATHHEHLVLPHAVTHLQLREGKVTSFEHLSPAEGSGSSVATKSETGGSEAEASATGTKGSSSGLSATATPGGSDQERADARDTAELLYELEGRRQGGVQWTLLKVYAGAAPPLPWVVVITFHVLARFATAGEQYWLKVWGESAARLTDHLDLAALYTASAFPPASGHQAFYLLGYGGIGLSIITFVLLSRFSFIFAQQQASRKIFKALLSNLIRAPMSWWDANPFGRVAQRLGADFSVVDTDLPSTSLSIFEHTSALSTYIIICTAIVPWLLLPSALLFILGPWAVRGFLAASRDMQRVESTSTSPMYDSFFSVMQGIVTIRAFGAEACTLEGMGDITARTMAQWWALATHDVWLSFRCQVLGGVAVFVASVAAITGAVSPGSAGMVMSSAALITQRCLYIASESKNLVNNMNSLERIVEYRDVGKEAPAILDDQRPPAAWPSPQADIKVEDLAMRYRPKLPLVLKGISFDVKPREKIGVVGRTGSGKTSLMGCFLRMTPFEGQIAIEGLNISSIGLDDLRQRIAVVPQDPVLFGQETVRSNLDPFNEHTDAEMIHALVRVKLDVISKSPTGTDGYGSTLTSNSISLDTPVSAGGANFSAGQAQLLCLARALLRGSQIVLLDEATSNTDHETDAAVQQVIRTQLSDRIVITVAHRIRTIMDYDRILVMSHGSILEFDTPSNLLAKKDGAFRKMADADTI